MSDELSGICVLVTRPSHQAENLVHLIESHGGEALRFPTLEIEANADRDTVLAAIGDIANYDIAIFISFNAVSNGVQYLPAEGKRPLLAAIGPSTARALRDAGFTSDIKPTRGFTSEALLHEPALKDVAGKRIVIFRGSGGRALLGRELERRGATVTYAEVYRRDRPEALDPEIESRLAAGTVDIVTVTSAETLVNLYELAEERSVTELARTLLVTTSDRVVKKAAALGFEKPALLAKGPDDQALVDAMLEWRRDSSQTDLPTGKATGTTMTDPSKHEHDKPVDDTAGSGAGVVDEAVISDTSQSDATDAVSGADAGARSPDSTPEKQPDSEPDNEEPAIKTPPKETLSAPAPVAAKKSGGGFLSLLAILLSLAALAASGYVWWGQQQTGSATAETQRATDEAITTTRQEIAALGGRLDDSLSRLSRLDAGRGRIQSTVDDMRGSVETLTARVQGAEKSIDDVRGISAAARSNWVRAEAEYFLQAANSRLQLAGDPDAALAALEAADDRMKSLGDPTLFRVRQELANEIATLKALPRPDVEGMAHTLNGLATRVEQLPLKNASPGSYQAANGDTAAEEKGAMARAAATIGRAMTSMISIKRTDEEATPLLSRDEEFFLKRNLELQLQTARLALLRGEASSYTGSLRTARNWLQTHFKTDAAAVQSAARTLAELETAEIAPSLPDISGSLRLLRLSKPAQATAPGMPPAADEAAAETDDDDTPEDAGDTPPDDAADNAANNEEAA